MYGNRTDVGRKLDHAILVDDAQCLNAKESNEGKLTKCICLHSLLQSGLLTLSETGGLN